MCKEEFTTNFQRTWNKDRFCGEAILWTRNLGSGTRISSGSAWATYLAWIESGVCEVSFHNEKLSEILPSLSVSADQQFLFRFEPLKECWPYTYE